MVNVFLPPATVLRKGRYSLRKQHDTDPDTSERAGDCNTEFSKKKEWSNRRLQRVMIGKVEHNPYVGYLVLRLPIKLHFSERIHHDYFLLVSIHYSSVIIGFTFLQKR